MMALLALWARIAPLLAAMSVIAPDAGHDDRHEIARSILDAGATPEEARWLVAIAWRESSFRASAVGDSGRSYCWAQIHTGPHRTAEGWSGPDLASDPDRCAVVALRVLRTSLASCSSAPADERLAAYAAGSCGGVRGRRLSRDRAALARRAFGGVL